MSNIFLYADSHYTHQGVCNFFRADGVTKLRPWNTAEEMDDALVDNFNNTVGVNDKCYMLGDIAINRKGLKVLERLKCKNLVLIKGNHDIFKLEDYLPYFRDVRGYHVMNGMILSHIPIHPDCIARFGSNIHGHLHSNRVMMTNESGESVIDPRYYSVSVEQIDFKPIAFEEVNKRIKEQGGVVGFQQGDARVEKMPTN